LSAGSTSIGCAVTDYACQCKDKAALTSAVTSCVVAACSIADVLLVQSSTDAVCTCASSGTTAATTSCYPIGSSPTTGGGDGSGYSTSTILSTSTYTITSCAATVLNCPIGKVTETVYTSTTYCPVSTTAAVGTTKVGGTSTGASVTKAVSTAVVSSSSTTKSTPAQVTGGVDNLRTGVGALGAAVLIAVLL
jgi:chitinase